MCDCCADDLVKTYSLSESLFELVACCNYKMCSECISKLHTGSCPYCRRRILGAFSEDKNVKIKIVKKTDYLRWNPRRNCRK